MLFYGAVVLLSCVLYGASAVLCKFGLQRDVPRDPRMGWWGKTWAALRSRYWLMGWLCGAAANIIIVQVQTFADITLVYSLLNFAYVFTLMMGYVFLHELLTREQWIGVGAAILGTMMLLFVNDPATGHATAIFHLGLMAVVSLLVVVILVLFAVWDRRQIHELYFATCAGIAFGNVETFLKTNTNLIISNVGHFSILSGESVIAFFMTWPFAFIVVFSIIGFVCMQLAYAHGDVSVSVPLIIVTQRPVTLFAGYFVFDEAFPVMKVLGILTMLISIVVITVSTIKRNDESKAIEAAN